LRIHENIFGSWPWIDKIFEEMWEALGKPPVMAVDLRPVGYPLLLVTSHEIAEQVSRPSKLYPLSTPKSPTWTHMAPIIGMTSILGKEVSPVQFWETNEPVLLTCETQGSGMEGTAQEI